MPEPKPSPSSSEVPGSEASCFKYYAFISYSRADDRAAKWLQKRLEWFRLPIKLVAQEHLPPRQKYVRPIYRDKTNLEVDHAHYWQNIKQAIEQSRFLIVLCSPYSAKSGPVNLEVNHFLETRRSTEFIKFVVPVILAGQVTAHGEEACLCPALRQLGEQLTTRNLPTMVPDAGDPEKEGWENGFLGLIAYLLSLKRESLTDHIRREERKRTARSRLLAAVFATLALTAGVFGWLSVSRKRLAEQNEVRANNTLGTLLTEQARSVPQDEAHVKLRMMRTALNHNPSDRTILVELIELLDSHSWPVLTDAKSWPAPDTFVTPKTEDIWKLQLGSGATLSSQEPPLPENKNEDPRGQAGERVITYESPEGKLELELYDQTEDAGHSWSLLGEQRKSTLLPLFPIGGTGIVATAGFGETRGALRFWAEEEKGLAMVTSMDLPGDSISTILMSHDSSIMAAKGGSFGFATWFVGNWGLSVRNLLSFGSWQSIEDFAPLGSFHFTFLGHSNRIAYASGHQLRFYSPDEEGSIAGLPLRSPDAAVISDSNAIWIKLDYPKGLGETWNINDFKGPVRAEEMPAGKPLIQLPEHQQPSIHSSAGETEFLSKGRPLPINFWKLGIPVNEARHSAQHVRTLWETPMGDLFIMWICDPHGPEENNMVVAMDAEGNRVGDIIHVSSDEVAITAHGEGALLVIRGIPNAVSDAVAVKMPEFRNLTPGGIVSRNIFSALEPDVCLEGIKAVCDALIDMDTPKIISDASRTGVRLSGCACSVCRYARWQDTPSTVRPPRMDTPEYSLNLVKTPIDEWPFEQFINYTFLPGGTAETDTARYFRTLQKANQDEDKLRHSIFSSSYQRQALKINQLWNIQLPIHVQIRKVEDGHEAELASTHGMSHGEFIYLNPEPAHWIWVNRLDSRNWQTFMAKGEYLSKIAPFFGLETDDLRRCNFIYPEGPLPTGTTVHIPAPTGRLVPARPAPPGRPTGNARGQQ